MTGLAGRAALVTGASRGIGLEVSRALAREGMRVAMIARSEAELRARADELGHDAFAFACDVGDAAAVARTTARVAEAFTGVPDVLVNNAGSFALAAVEATTPEQFQHALDVNLVGPFLFVRALLPAMRERRTGHIVTLGSIADRAAFRENGAYAASKFGLRGLHEVLRAELRGSGIRTTLVSPGPVDTPIWDAVDPDARPGFTPRASMLRAADVAAAVVYAISQPATVNVDELRLSHA